MKPELDDALVRDFPSLYKLRYADPKETCMCWGFDCGDGWEPIIRRLSYRIAFIIKSLPPEERDDYYADQVKEKYGALRFYMSYYNDAIEECIKEAEAESTDTCEQCGAPGTLWKNKGWLKTVCEECKK